MRLRFAAAFAIALLAACSARPRPLPPAPTAPVGRLPDGSQQMPVNQLLTPHGGYVDLPGLRPQVTALSRDGSRIYVSGKTSELIALSAEDGSLLQRVKMPSDRLREPSSKPPAARMTTPRTPGRKQPALRSAAKPAPKPPPKPHPPPHPPESPSKQRPAAGPPPSAPKKPPRPGPGKRG